MKKKINDNIEVALTNESGNFFFGFHDLVAWNFNGDKIAALRIMDITTPPKPDIPCEVGFIKDGSFTKLGETFAYNYPQGARQQWIGKTNLLVVNDKKEDKWISKVYDTESRSQIDILEYPTHIVTDQGWAFALDYARLHRVGGYGYTGLQDKSAKNHAPKDTGIFKHNIYTKEATLLISINTVASFEANIKAGKHHYLTHLVLDPSQKRIAFLHRCKLNDGGETTRLMTIGTDGSDLRCLASGFLSHFDWKDESHIAIWGRTGTSIETLRNSLLYRIIPTKLISFAKNVIKSIKKNSDKGDKLKESSFNWLLIKDANFSEKLFLAKGIIVEDGHPMFCPNNRDWLVCDNYPDINGNRTLFLFQYSTQKKIDLGTYKMLNDKPNIDNLGDALKDVESSVLQSFSIENMAFYRSGLHCDLHPRWKGDGSTIAFDSIHEGKRKIYSFSVKSILLNT